MDSRNGADADSSAAGEWAVGRLLHISERLWRLCALKAFILYPAFVFYVAAAPTPVLGVMPVVFALYSLLCGLMESARVVAIMHPEGVSCWNMTCFREGTAIVLMESMGLLLMHSMMLCSLLLVQGEEQELGCLVLLSLLIVGNSLVAILLVTSAELRRRHVALRKVKTSGPMPFSQVTESSASACGTCAICLETYAENDMVVQLPCRHIFHPACIGPWLQASNQCPYRCARRHSTGKWQAPPEAQQRPATAGSEGDGGEDGDRVVEEWDAEVFSV